MRRCILLLIAISIGLVSHAQGTLQHASVQVDLSIEEIHIAQRFHLDLPDTTKYIQLSAIRYDHLSLSDITTPSGHYKLSEQDGAPSKLYSYKINITENHRIEDLAISYTWQRTTEKAEIPLFFPDMPAASSNDSLFVGEIQLAEELAFRMDFPKVDYDEVTEDSKRRLLFTLPALPSLLRIQYGDQSKLSTNVGLIADCGIALVFLIMAVIIWLNRKRLTYG